MQEKLWVYQNTDREKIKKISEEYHIPKLVAALLVNRDIENISYYLTKSMQMVHHPNEMKDMKKGAARIAEAISSKENIVIYGDYDVDGITSTSLLYLFLKEQGATVSYYIPDRIEEGYGINIMAVNKLAKKGAKLLITVDCGITSVGEVSLANALGMDVIITDHHTCKEKVPEATAVINPKQPDCTYPFKGLAGVGVAFKLMLSVVMQLGLDTRTYFDRYVEIVALGTIADVVPLIDENRIIADRGLISLSNTNREGLKALLELSGFSDKPLTASSLAFSVCPRMNAAGRLGTAETAVKLLTTTSKEEAYEIARRLDEENRNRQATEKQILKEAMGQIASDPDFAKKKVIVLYNPDWHHGVIGIVASRICEQFYRPCILITSDGTVGKGSGRSIASFNLFDALEHCSSLLTNFGGHAVAAGLGIMPEDISAFTQEINVYADSVLTEEDLIARIFIDCEISPIDVRLESAKLLTRLEPFGMGNPKPVFSLSQLSIASITRMGIEQKHLRLRLVSGTKSINAVGFHMGAYFSHFAIGDTVDIACTMELNHFQGTESVQLILKDIRKSI